MPGRYLILILVTFFCQKLYSQNFNLVITISNIKNFKGEIKIALYNNKYSFLQKNEEFKTVTLVVKKSSETCMVKDLPKGDYAVAVFHDKNSDGICNSNFFGIPEEGYGFSNNYRPILSKPSFNNCKINLIANTQIAIKLIL